MGRKGKRKLAQGANAQSAVRSLEAAQQRLWNLALAICVVLFFILSVWLIGIELSFFPSPGKQAMATMEMADLMAVSVCAIELYKRYRLEGDKREFFRKNWLEIIVLLPFGFMFRAFRIFEGLPVLRAAAPVLRFSELELALPGITVSARPVARGIVAAKKWLAHFHVVTSFFSKVADFFGGIARIGK